MTKIPPFGCDVRGASAEQKREFLELLTKTDRMKFGGICEYYGWSIYNTPDNAIDKDEAIQKFTRIIPIEQGIALLKGEEEKYEIHPIHLTNGKMATFHIPKNATEADIMMLISKLETIVANTINPPKQ